MKLIKKNEAKEPSIVGGTQRYLGNHMFLNKNKDG